MNLLKKLIKKNLIWLLVIVPIILSIIGTKYELAGFNIKNHFLWGPLLSLFDNIRYGHYIVRKFFLVIIAFSVFIYWLKKQNNVFSFFQSNFKYLAIIGLTLILSRVLTFNFWFYNDDTRFFSWQIYAPTLPNYNPQAHWGPYQSYPIAFFLLLISWFKTNYALYNILGIFFYFLAGTAIFALGNVIQKNKFVSLMAAIFFLTTPTNFQGRLLVGEIVGAPFTVLLILLSFYLLLRKFVPGALIFAAAALEFGVAKTYIMALPLTLFSIFFVFNRSIKNNVKISKKSLYFLIISVIAISLVYLNTFLGVVPKSRLFDVGIFGKLIIFGDVLLAVTTPLILTQPLVKLLNFLLHNWIYLTTVLGFIVALVFSLIGLIAFLKKKFLATKLIFIGLSIILPTALISSLMGVRIDHNIQKLVEYVINTPIPTGATGYGILPALGLSIILISIGTLFNNKTFKVLAISLILINIVSSYIYDFRWARSPYGYPQRRFNVQLQKSLSRDGTKKYIFVPASQQPLFQGINTFADVFQGDQVYYRENDPDTFVATLKKENPPADYIYFFVTSGHPKYDVYDYSDKIRDIPFDKLSLELKSLIEELIPKKTVFFVF
ncbi:MAG: hypothetical protein ABH812_01745 [bacterium]